MKGSSLFFECARVDRCAREIRGVVVPNENAEKKKKKKKNDVVPLLLLFAFFFFRTTLLPNERKKGTFCVNALWSRRKIYIYICELVQKERERERVCVCLTKNVRCNKNDTCARLYSKEERKDYSYFNDECNFESERRE